MSEAVQPTTPQKATAANAHALRRKPRPRESLIQSLLFFCGTVSIVTTVGIVLVLGSESVAFFARTLWENTNKSIVARIDPDDREFVVERSGAELFVGDVIRISDEVMEITAIDGARVTVTRGLRGTEAAAHEAGLPMEAGDRVSLLEFFTTTKWNPQLGDFGIWPLVNATFITTAIAMVVALPLGLSVAIYLNEYASKRARSIVKPALEVLAGIPTVVYGYFALTFVTPILRAIFGDDVVQVFNTGAAGLVMGVLILPLVSSMSGDALSAVPNSLRQAAQGLGATRLETAVQVVVPAAFSGLTAAFIVALSRALGETMIVAIAAGAGPAFTFNPFDAAETLTGHIVRISGGDLSYNSIDYNSLFAIGLLLFLMTFTLNLLSRRIVRRFQEVYE